VLDAAFPADGGRWELRRSSFRQGGVPMQLLVLDRHDFNEMLEHSMPQIAPKLLAVVGARMRAIEEQAGVNATLGL
jgi:CRP-like cAMP-binding protein